MPGRIREIPRDRWKDFLEGFSLRHEGWLVDVETIGPSGSRTRARQVPLHRIATAPEVDRIAIRLGSDDRTEHDVSEPLSIELEEEDGAERAVWIRSESGDDTRVSFRRAVLPEAVDGILPE